LARRSDSLASIFSRSDSPRYFVGVLEGIVYSTEVQNRYVLIHGTEMAATGIGNLPRQLVTVRDSIQRHCMVCVREEGVYFEHLLRCACSALTSLPSLEQIGILKWQLKNATKERIIFSLFISLIPNKEILTCFVKKNCFHFIKNDSHNNKSRHRYINITIP
jgi:hypothetical protein